MKALVCEAYGPPESLKLVDLPDPAPGAGEALVDVSYASLNFFDLLVIENKYQAKPPLPFSPAAEFSGRIAALGRDVEKGSRSAIASSAIPALAAREGGSSGPVSRASSRCPKVCPRKRRPACRSPTAPRSTP